MKVSIQNLISLDIKNSENCSDNGRLACKFVLIQRPEEMVVVVGLVSEYPYHATLVQRFCDINGIPSGWVKKPDLAEIYDPSVRIQGGGYIMIDRSKRQMKLYGRSTAYGAFDPEKLIRIVELDPFFTEFRVEIAR